MATNNAVNAATTEHELVSIAAAEFMGATHGLGFLLIDGQTTGRPATLITSILLFALCGKATDGCLAWVSERALHWQDGPTRLRLVGNDK